MDGTQWGDTWDTLGKGWDNIGKGWDTKGDGWDIWDTMGGHMGHDREWMGHHRGTHGTP